MSGCTADRHGTASAYGNYGCRCDTARKAKVRQQKQYELRFTLRGARSLRDATGTRRRLEALHAIGWRTADLGPMLHVTPSAVTKIRGSAQVQHATATAVAALYDRLADHRGPSERTAQRAKTRGWLVPLWWDDDTIDDPTFDPIQVYDDKDIASTSRAARRSTDTSAVAELTAQGLSAKEIGERLRSSPRRVVRIRAALRAATRPATSDPVRTMHDVHKAAS